MKLYIEKNTKEISSTDHHYTIPAFYVGDRVSIYLCWRANGAHLKFLETDSFVVAIGNTKKKTILAFSDSFVYKDGYVEVALNLNTQELRDALGSKRFLDSLSIEVELTRDDEVLTIGQSACLVYTSLISAGVCASVTEELVSSLKSELLTAIDEPRDYINLNAYDCDGKTLLDDKTVKVKAKIVNDIPTIFFE